MANSKHGLLRMNNRNTLYDADLSRSLMSFQREHIFTMAHIEYEKQELKQFLKELYHCESDNDPAAIR